MRLLLPNPLKNFSFGSNKCYKQHKKREKEKRPQGLHTLGSLLFSASIGGILFRQLRVGCYRNPIEDERADTESHDANSTDGKSQLGRASALEGWQRTVAVLDEHRLHDEQVVVQADDCVDQSDEYYAISPCSKSGVDIGTMNGSHKHEELREHTGEWRNTAQ